MGLLCEIEKLRLKILRLIQESYQKDMKKSELAYNGVMNEMTDFYKRHSKIDNGEIV